MIYGTILPGAKNILRLPKLSKSAKQRLKWFDYYRQCGNAAKTCRYFGISRKTFHKWKKRYSAYYLPTLENKSCKPHRVRQSKIPIEQVILLKRLRTKYPYYSKYKLAVILKRDHGVALSTSTIGRIIKKNNLFFKPKYPSKKKRYASRITIERKRLPKDYEIQAPGDLIESDMKHMPFLGNKLYAFVAIDCVGKGIAIRVSSTSSSLQNAKIIGQAKQSFPFLIKAWENDNGSENLKDFHAKLNDEGIPQYYAHPYCPKDKPFVERVIGTLEREFIQQGNLVTTVEEQQRRIDAWLDEYHNFRPHQSLGYLTPNEYYQKTIGKTIKQVLPM
ncbi:MAG: integrase core domain-containing protein [Candidatus Sungbacteria bacterium]|nr:integrase core domain-containing protein [Candidatus Sungbacteria bacterium]